MCVNVAKILNKWISKYHYSDAWFSHYFIKDFALCQFPGEIIVIFYTAGTSAHFVECWVNHYIRTVHIYMHIVNGSATNIISLFLVICSSNIHICSIFMYACTNHISIIKPHLCSMLNPYDNRHNQLWVLIFLNTGSYNSCTILSTFWC